MTRDFDPYRVPEHLSRWMLGQTEAERDRAVGEFAKRAVAAAHVLDAVAHLREAYRLTEDSRLPASIQGLVEVARSLHDYDPTSD